MPPPAEGGGKWMSTLFSLTQSMQLAVGDFRGILGRQVSLWDLDKGCHPGSKQQGKKEEVMTAQEQLLKMQLDEALKKLNDKHKEEKQMVQQFSRQEYDFGPGHLEKIMDKKDHTNTKGGWKKKMGSSKKKDWIGLN
ncbi:hypothetical protein D4764_0180670 [Takifugu flavidus]|uniref:Uncharacterized protein n=1 Tax=Takifugu flavidus TaxID=433684 RepID=A0A5C6MHT8_9TELE|nr:hypothetical protein D4764_0180670 [Takifugu flavidus]